jgi:hypothetical protein
MLMGHVRCSHRRCAAHMHQGLYLASTCSTLLLRACMLHAACVAGLPPAPQLHCTPCTTCHLHHLTPPHPLNTPTGSLRGAVARLLRHHQPGPRGALAGLRRQRRQRDADGHRDAAGGGQQQQQGGACREGGATAAAQRGLPAGGASWVARLLRGPAGEGWRGWRGWGLRVCCWCRSIA